MDFTFKIFAQPSVAMVPMAVIFVAYFSHQRLPLGLPGGMVAIVIGTLLGWMLGTMDGKALVVNPALALPVFTGGSLWEALNHPAFLGYFSVIFPMGIFNRRLPAKYRKRRGRRRPLPNFSVLDG